MWPFKKSRAAKAPSGDRPLLYTQADITDGFGDETGLGPEDWVGTTPLNVRTPNPESMGLPPLGAGDEQIYDQAARLSEMREAVPFSAHDGVYCPVCHIANVERAKLRAPCPKCGRPLLTFGWE